MRPKLFELRPDRNLLNPDFNGYKLSLDKIPIIRKEFEFETKVDRVLPNSEQYSLLHVKIFGLHNHLFTDHFNNNVYFVDNTWTVRKVTLNPLNGQLNELESVWHIPEQNKRKPGHYNVSLHFVNETFVVLSDGTGTLHLIKTENRAQTCEEWTVVFSDEVLDSDPNPDQGFIIQDAVYKSDSNRNELHCLLVNIERSETEFSTVLNWITLNQTNDLNWVEASMRVLKAPGGFYYCAFETNCKYLYIASDRSFKFVLDSEKPIGEEKLLPEPKKVYAWIQTDSDITIRFNATSTCNRNDFIVNVSSDHVSIHYKDTVLLQGNLSNRIDNNLTTWSVSNNILEVVLIKAQSDLIWNELIIGDEKGEQILDPSVVAEVHERLAHLCSDTEVIPVESGPAFSTQQIEECDDTENTAIFERFSDEHEVTHRANLGSHQMIMTVNLRKNKPASLVIRHDVDACVWTPQMQTNDQPWSLLHEGTLLAFGYVQASKQQRKFSSCSPDLSYSVVCESMRHVFLYRQQQMVTSGELRNRRSGERVDTIAQQQVISLSDDEILGLSATNEILYLLTEHSILVLKI